MAARSSWQKRRPNRSGIRPYWRRASTADQFGPGPAWQGATGARKASIRSPPGQPLLYGSGVKRQGNPVVAGPLLDQRAAKLS